MPIESLGEHVKLCYPYVPLEDTVGVIEIMAVTLRKPILIIAYRLITKYFSIITKPLRAGCVCRHLKQ